MWNFCIAIWLHVYKILENTYLAKLLVIKTVHAQYKVQFTENINNKSTRNLRGTL